MTTAIHVGTLTIRTGDGAEMVIDDLVGPADQVTSVVLALIQWAT